MRKCQLASRTSFARGTIFLPAEIIDLVCNVADYGAHFGLACSCRRLCALMKGRADPVIAEAAKYVSAKCDGAMLAAYVLPNGAYHAQTALVVWKSSIEILFSRGVPTSYRAGPVGTDQPIYPCTGLDWDRLGAKFHDVVHSIQTGSLHLTHPFDF